MAIAFGNMVHEDVSSGPPCPVVSHVDHRAGDKVVPGVRRTERGVWLHESCGHLCQVNASPRQVSAGPPSSSAQVCRGHPPSSHPQHSSCHSWLHCGHMVQSSSWLSRIILGIHGDLRVKNPWDKHLPRTSILLKDLGAKYFIVK